MPKYRVPVTWVVEAAVMVIAKSEEEADWFAQRRLRASSEAAMDTDLVHFENPEGQRHTLTTYPEYIEEVG